MSFLLEVLKNAVCMAGFVVGAVAVGTGIVLAILWPILVFGNWGAIGSALILILIAAVLFTIDERKVLFTIDERKAER